MTNSDPPDQALPRPRGAISIRPAPGVRRTTSIDVVWPQGRRGGMCLLGQGRDIQTLDAHVPPTLLAHEHLRLDLGPDRKVLAVLASPKQLVLDRLVGPGQEVRAALRSLLEAGSLEHTPVYQLADDMPGVMVVAAWAWSRWPDLVDPDETVRRRTKLSKMEGVCIGFRPGSSALATAGAYQDAMAVEVPLLYHPDDPYGWHSMSEFAEVSLRRARCIDVWRSGERLQIEAYFQDSGTAPDGRRIAVHEYTIHAHADWLAGTLLDVHATPHVLPFPECRGAVDRMHALLGLQIESLRTAVPDLLGRTRGCTHLNDALRALADVPRLARQLMLGTGSGD